MANLPRPESMEPFKYSDFTVPPQYHCGKCGAHGVKLWREYQTFLENQTLMCAACACEEQSNKERTFSITQDEKGHVSVTRTPDPYGIQGGDQIGWRIPAVPTEDGQTYWGYCSIGSGGVAWWERLPLEIQEPTKA